MVATVFAASEHGPALRAELAATGVALPPGGASPLPFVDVFPSTSDGKIHLVPAALDREAHGLYTYRPDPGTERFPLALISPAIARQISSTFGQLSDAPATIEIAHDDAVARGISDGDPVRVWNDLGEVHCLAKLSHDVRAGVCSMPKGLWRKHSANGMTSNALIPAAFADLGGQAAYNDARVDIAKR
jgi:anaerobic selenocysteine-containing dehydrogenase